jgi:hypothetical protein
LRCSGANPNRLDARSAGGYGRLLSRSPR